MSKQTTITIVRHGETEWNIAMRLQGKQDSPLTENGYLQVEMVTRALRNKTFDAIISSDLGRAIDTANIINRYHNKNVIFNENLRERNFGVMEGLTREEIKERFKEVFDGYMLRKEHYEIPEGESLVAFYNRVSGEINKIAEEYSGENILIIAHGGVLDCMMRMIFNIPLSSRRAFSIYNAAINTFSYSNKKWTLEQWGNTDHFNDVESMDEQST